MSVIGFDIGSESAVIAVARAGGIDIILNEASSRATPVLVSFQGKQRHIGAAAESLVRSNYKNTIGDMKRFLGRNFSEPSVQKELKDTYLTAKQLPNDEIGFKVNYNDSEEYVTPTQCLAMVLGKLKTTVEAGSGLRASNVVISVPIYYTDRQRRAVLDAAEIAGLRCQKLLNEPTACAIGYGYPKSVKKQLDPEKPLTIMFADMGYTDFTVSIVEFYQGKMIVKGVAADKNCGGHDIDRAVVAHLVEEFKKKTKLDCSGNPKAIMSLYRVAEKAKKTLSPYGVDTVAVNSECLYQDRDLACHLDIATFNKLCESLVPKIGATVAKALEASKLSLEAINDVEIVGGSLRVRWAKEALAKAVNRKVDDLHSHLNMDEACSRGCALQSAILSPTIRMQEFEIQDYVPYTINLLWEDEKGPDSTALFKKGEVSPFTRKITFARNKSFTIKAKYDDAANDFFAEGTNHLVGEYLIKDVPSATESGAVPTVRVFTEHDKDGIFRIKKVEYMKEVKKEEPKEGETAEKKEGEEEIADKKGDKKTYVAVSLPFVETNTGSLTPEQMVAFQAKEGKMAAQDRELVEKDAKKNELETYVYDMRDKLSDKFKPYATSSDSDALNAMLDQVESWLYSDEGYEGTLVSFQGKLDSCKKLGDPITLRYDEAQERPIAVSEFNNAIENGKRFLNKQGIDEAFFHLTDDDWAKLRDTNKEYKTWMAEEVYKQGSKALTDPPAFTADSVRRKLANYNQICNPIMNKPKPKEVPKATETKKEEAAPDAAPAGEGETKPEGETPFTKMEVE